MFEHAAHTAPSDRAESAGAKSSATHRRIPALGRTARHTA
ncbi:hypothetical protein BDSB_12415 [Burkholderia dolosa PC543]|nr:hypothetical protein BDSB_12415 [Burkholderia dolosa PC543]